jgi:hypothetical protein
MRIITSDGNETLREIARRVFKVRGTRAELRERKSVAALLAANPHLAPNRSIPTGTVVVVPDAESLPRPEVGAAGLSARSSGEHAAVVRKAMETAAGSLYAAADHQRRADEAMLELLEKHKRELKSADEDVQAQVAKVQKAAAVRAKALDAQAKRAKANFGQLSKQFDEFVKLMNSA